MGLIARFPLPASLGGPSTPTLQSWQWSFNGLALGAGTSYGVKKVTGLNLANIRSGDQSVPRDHGELIGLDLYGGRDVTMELWMSGTGGLIANQLALSAAFQIQSQGASETPLWFQLPSQSPLCVMARVRNRDMPWDADYAAGGKGEPAVKLHCTDPRIYTAGQSQSISLSSSGGGGLGFPVGPFPVTFGASSSGSATINNAGNMEMRPIVIFNGPVTNPWIQNNTIASSPYLQFKNPAQSSYTVLAGDQLVVDLGVPHRALYYSGGFASGVTPSAVLSWLVQGVSTWWDLLPGNNSVKYGSSDTTMVGIGAAQVVWASAYQL
jgi:hypothetical protein